MVKKRKEKEWKGHGGKNWIILPEKLMIVFEALLSVSYFCSPKLIKKNFGTQHRSYIFSQNTLMLVMEDFNIPSSTSTVYWVIRRKGTDGNAFDSSYFTFLRVILLVALYCSNLENFMWIYSKEKSSFYICICWENCSPKMCGLPNPHIKKMNRQLVS